MNTNLYNENLENRTNKVYKTITNTAKESYTLGKEYIMGVLAIPYVLFAAPSVIEKSKIKPSVEPSTSGCLLAAAGLGTFIGSIPTIIKYVEENHILKEHPYLLAIPIVTNLISAGYEKQKRGKQNESRKT